MASPYSISPLPGSDAIGHSYDVFGFYANPLSVKWELFNFADQIKVNAVDRTYLVSTDFQLQMINVGFQKTFDARTKDEYSRNLATSVSVTVGFSCFSASIENDFSSSISSQTDTTYTHILANVAKWKLSLKDDIEALRPKMTTEFKEKLATMNPVDLFARYGTHFLGEVIVGGRANYVATTKTSAFKSSSELRIAAEASFSMVSNKDYVSDEKIVQKFRSNSFSTCYTIGGEPVPDIRDNEEYSAWLNSIDKKPVFSGFTVDSLIPIWKLAETQDRQEELKLATQSFVPSYIMQLTLRELTVISSKNPSEPPPYGFTKINHDLNEGARGKFIYVCYKQEKLPVSKKPGDPIPITSIHIAVGKNPSIPSGYRKINKDLNEGARGEYIYLCYSRDADKAEEGLPIRSICVIGGRHESEQSAPYGFTKINVDLNYGARGEFIYLCYSRHLDGV